MVEINKYWRSIFFVPWCKTLLASKTVSQAPPIDEHFDLFDIFYPTFPLSCVWNSAMVPIMFYKLQTCSDNGKSADFLFNCPLVTSHTLYFRLLAPPLLRSFFEVLFLNLY